MNIKKILCILFSIIWIAGVLAQHITWIIDGKYSLMAFVWALLELCLPYVIYKAITED